MTNGAAAPPRVYEPPTDGEDLNPIELAIVRALTAIILRERREEAAAARTDAHTPAAATNRRAG